MEESPDNKNDSFTLSFQEYNILLFLPKSKWIPDEKVDNCFNCNKRFMYLLRRKHHCRKCGFIFCDK